MDIRNITEYEEIKAMAERIAAAVHPLKIYLFGSFARGDHGLDGGYDFYVVVSDNVSDTFLVASNAQEAVGLQRIRPVDILVK